MSEGAMMFSMYCIVWIIMIVIVCIVGAIIEAARTRKKNELFNNEGFRELLAYMREDD